MTPDFRSNNTHFWFKPEVFLQVYSSLDAEYPCYSRLMGLIDRFPAGNPILKKDLLNLNFRSCRQKTGLKPEVPKMIFLKIRCKPNIGSKLAELKRDTENRIRDLGIGCDLLCLGEQPLHAVPLFRIKTGDSEAWQYEKPDFINLNYYQDSPITLDADTGKALKEHVERLSNFRFLFLSLNFRLIYVSEASEANINYVPRIDFQKKVSIHSDYAPRSWSMPNERKRVSESFSSSRDSSCSRKYNFYVESPKTLEEMNLHDEEIFMSDTARKKLGLNIHKCESENFHFQIM